MTSFPSPFPVSSGSPCRLFVDSNHVPSLALCVCTEYCAPYSSDCLSAPRLLFSLGSWVPWRTWHPLGCLLSAPLTRSGPLTHTVLATPSIFRGDARALLPAPPVRGRRPILFLVTHTLSCTCREPSGNNAQNAQTFGLNTMWAPCGAQPRVTPYSWAWLNRLSGMVAKEAFSFSDLSLPFPLPLQSYLVPYFRLLFCKTARFSIFCCCCFFSFLFVLSFALSPLYISRLLSLLLRKYPRQLNLTAHL